MSRKLVAGLLILSPLLGFSQSASPSGYWQQKVKYSMEVDVDAPANQFKGKQKLEYWNNSPDTLTRVFYHLYWNAFQPGSMMDERSRRQGGLQKPGGAPDWDNRVKDRIQKLQKNEIGYQRIISLKMNGRAQQYKVNETILEVKLDKPILPKGKAVFEMDFEAQVPVQIRRSGRDNAEGVRFSMSQWYPKLCEYDAEGWHPTPYIAREFYGVWGDYDVKISIDKNYVIGATGYLQNPLQIGHGYEPDGAAVTKPSGNKLRWHFVAPNVHDFVWAADPEYVHKKVTVRDGLVLHAFYKIAPEMLKKQYESLPATRKAEYENNPDNFVNYYRGQWEDALELAKLALPYIETTFGRYPYNQYSFIQGGDGGMEYPMATLLKGAGPDVVIHEWMHSWYQGVLANNESIYPWMDEGFADYAENRVLSYLTRDTAFAYRGSYQAYTQLAKSNREEPLTTHADHFNTNYAHTTSAYTKGCVFVEQLGYITGAQVRDKILLEYYRQWKFRHPSANDFMRVAEKVSGMKLDWYKEYWINTIKTIDYSIDSLWDENGKTKIRLARIGQMPMPVDVQLTFKDGTKELHYVPLDLMYGAKPVEDESVTRKVYEPWHWTSQVYVIETSRKLLDVVSAEIDPSLRLADIERKNNKLELKW
ncbi:MAG TPA: M1 family metallopeptidase [Chitinophagaceae bacterium]